LAAADPPWKTLLLGPHLLTSDEIAAGLLRSVLLVLDLIRSFAMAFLTTIRSIEHVDWIRLRPIYSLRLHRDWANKNFLIDLGPKIYCRRPREMLMASQFDGRDTVRNIGMDLRVVCQ
jgi:hypothetical protein